MLTRTESNNKEVIVTNATVERYRLLTRATGAL